MSEYSLQNSEKRTTLDSHKNSKVLIWDNYQLSTNDGGPSGFLAQNISHTRRYENFTTLSEQTKEISRSKLKALNVRLSLFINTRINKKYGGTDLFKFKQFDLDRFKVFYFHDIYSLARLLPYLKSNKKIILQSHSPELPSSELRNMECEENVVNKTKEAEKICFERADLIVLPNEACQIIYEELIPNNKPIKYILSGCKDFRDVYSPIPLDDNYLNILFIGRQNEIKGFDILIEAFNKVCEIRKDVRLFLLGKGPSNFRNPQIISIGFTDRPQAWFSSVDYIINVNRQSYFDLSIMEALSCGTKIIMTKTEGHSFYKGLSEDIIEIEATQKSVYDKLLELKQEKCKGRYSQANRKIYEYNFTSENYVKRLESICTDVKTFFDLH